MKKIKIRFPGFKILDRYILGKFLATYFFAIAMIIVIVVIFDYAEKIDDFTATKAPLKAILFRNYVNFIPFFINQFSGLFTFIACIFFTSKMAYQTEIVAMLSGGMSFRRLMWPYFLGALIIASLSLTLNLWVIPRSQQRVLAFQQEYIPKKQNTRYDRHIYRQIEPGTFAYIRGYNGNARQASFFVLERYENNVMTRSLEASDVSFDPETKQGEIGVVAIWSPVLAETAASLTSASVPAAFKKGKKSIKEQIPTDTAILLSTFGVQQKIDENGNYVLVSYGQSAARTSNSRAKNAAYNKARLDADGQIRSFAGEAVVCSDALSEAEQSLDYNLEGQLPDYNDESSYNEYQQSVGKNLEINGITTIHRWTAVHPVSGQTVYGVVRMWSPVSGMKARQNKANIEASAKDGAAGRRSVAPVSSVTAQSGSAANTSTGSPMLNYGSQGDDDAF